MTVKNDITVAPNGPNASDTFTATGADVVSFTITLQDGCLTATLNSPTVNDMSTADGTSTTQTFADASDTFSSAINQLDFCGLRTYEVQLQSDGSAVSWASVAVDASNSANYIITINPSSSTNED